MGESLPAVSERARLLQGRPSYLSLRVSERRLLLRGLDLIAVNVALLAALAFRYGIQESWLRLTRQPHWLILLSFVWLLLASAFDCYDLRTSSCLNTSLPPIAKTAVISAAVYLAIPYLTPPLPDSRGCLLVFFLTLLGLPLVARLGYVLIFSQPAFARNTLIIGAGWAGQTIAETILEQGHLPYRVVGFVDDNLAKQGTTVCLSSADTPEATVNVRVLGSCDTLCNLVLRHRVTNLILAVKQVDGALLQLLTDCLELGVEVIPMAVLYEQLTGRVPIEYAGHSWYVAVPVHHPSTGGLYPLLKRFMDILLASLGIVALAPLFPFIALAIYLDSPGPIFYTQWRVGKGGRLFKACKFRSMVPNAEKGGAVWASRDDPRVTRVGRLLRRTHVDEFPQFINILRGEMSAVGPRPERPEFAEVLTTEIPFYRVRHAVKPGMAGWGLVKQGYGASKHDALLKLQYDLYYIKHQSLWLDLVILLKTVADTVTLRGRA